MPDFPVSRWPPLNVITPWHPESLFNLTSYYGPTGFLAAVSGAFADELVSYYPFRLYEPAIAVKMSYLVGATASGNVDLGIYSSQGNLLVSSGLTAQGSINTLQELDITDTLLQPGVYFMAIKCDSASGTAFRNSFNDENILPLAPFYHETTGAGATLPTTATFSITGLNDSIIAMGVHFSTLV